MDNVKIEKGDLYWGSLEGDEENIQTGIRPVIIIQNNYGNEISNTVIVCPITSVKSKEKFHVFLSKNKYNLKVDSYVLIEQIRTINKKNIGNKIDKLDEEDILLLDTQLSKNLDIFNNKLYDEFEKIANEIQKINGYIYYIHEYKLIKEFDFTILNKRSELIYQLENFQNKYSIKFKQIQTLIEETNSILKEFRIYYLNPKINNN